MARIAADSRALVLVAACALVDSDGRVLIAQRPANKDMAGLWEFPGGKVHAGERPEAALIRELKEELDIDVSEACLAPLTFASHRYDSFDLLMPLYVCRRWEGAPRAMEGQGLKWVRPKKLRDYPMPAADLPLIPHVIDML
ncbi:MAG TPA: (deoxy)nucleoside triphosphate pyrophosphohydrolase [Aestuariivirgaceae bacterium]|nr:(deoxy)nucleoside triphosphate pyrophosphohydrolase [Aestuariivirgaceae bacterium]